MTLADHYREHGESDKLHQLEHSLTDQWQPTADIARSAGLPRGGWTTEALRYLVDEGRAEHRHGHGVGGSRHEWRRA